MSTAFNLDDFISGINNDRVQPKNSKDRLNRVLMNVRDNQGTLTFIPCPSKGSRTTFYTKLNRVYEYYGDTSLIDNGEAWYRILPLDAYGDLTEDQKALYQEVKGYLDYLNDNEEVSYDEFRVRNYSLFYGVGLALKNTEGKKNEDIIDAPCLFVYPSANPINQLCDAINNKIDVMNGRKEWIPMVLSTQNSGRKGVVQVKFVKAEGAGYDCTVGFEFNSELNTVIDPAYEISDEMLSKFDDVMPCFLGWIYDNQNKKYFNEVAFKELRDQLKLRIKSMSGDPTPADAGQTYENKNNLTGQPAQPAQSSVEQSPSTGVRRPF